ncbi:MAG TPA: hypothetical protein VHP37_13380 [Burkholderiales bacterium]|nr:hypothetical protein [Burkholderiales bacterium]
MPFSPSSPVFELLRAETTEGGLSDGQLRDLVAYVERSPILERRLTGFERVGGRIVYNTDEVNCYWLDRSTEPPGPPTIYLAASFLETADIAGMVQIVAHELSHFETDAGTAGGFNPNAMVNKDVAAAAGCRDEARAYALEYLVQQEINRTQPRVDWMARGQEAAIRSGLDTLPADEHDEIRRLDAATRTTIAWAANWTGADPKAGGYFQFYQNEWLRTNPPGGTAAASKVELVCDASGNIVKLEYVAGAEGARIVILDPAVGGFTPGTRLA